LTTDHLPRVPVAQLDRASASGAEGYRFDSCRGYWRNVRAVQRFSRHRDVRVLERYDDKRRDLGGEIAKQVAASVPGEHLAS
jgi:hypothetical protein